MMLDAAKLGPRLGAEHAGLVRDVLAASQRTGRPIGITEHLLARVDWSEPTACPLRRQFLPTIDELEPDHPLCRPDPLAEAAGQQAPGLVRRYPDRALLLTTPRCPVYCAFCTRSWAVGPTGAVPRRQRWEQALAALEADDSIVDVTISGGDVWQLAPEELAWLGERLLALRGLERLRLASRGLVAEPDRIHQGGLLGVLRRLARQARERGVRIALHAHVNHPIELSPPTRRGAELLLEAGLTLRAQTVLLRGVNDSPQTMLALVRALVRTGIQPYYVYLADMAPGAEHLRTSLAHAQELEKQVRGRTAGFDMPGFVCDLLGGGGKRQVHSWERYDRDLGLAVFRSPVIDPDRLFLHADPLRDLDEDARGIWSDPQQRGLALNRMQRPLELRC